MPVSAGRHRAEDDWTLKTELKSNYSLVAERISPEVSIRTPEQTSAKSTTTISIAHSPDSDDAFMFYGLATNKVRVPGYRFSHTLCDIETLNRRAREEAFFDVTAISFHAYPYLQENYTLMGCGGSVGEGYGPMVFRQPQAGAERPGARSGCSSRDADDGVSCAEDLQSGDQDGDRAVRPDHSRDAGGEIRRGADHP